MVRSRPDDSSTARYYYSLLSPLHCEDNLSIASRQIGLRASGYSLWWDRESLLAVSNHILLTGDYEGLIIHWCCIRSLMSPTQSPIDTCFAVTDTCFVATDHPPPPVGHTYIFLAEKRSIWLLHPTTSVIISYEIRLAGKHHDHLCLCNVGEM